MNDINNDDVQVVRYNIQRPETKNTLRSGPQSSSRENQLNSQNVTQEYNKKKITKKFYIIIGLISGIIIIALIICIAIFLNKNKTRNVPNEIIEKENEQVLKPIYKLNNTVGDLKRINVEQISHKNMTVDGQNTQFLIYRNTTYDIYIMSEEKPKEKNKKKINKCEK